jgi:hypothetical protein
LKSLANYSRLVAELLDRLLTIELLRFFFT